MTSFLAIANQKGGVGKTTITVSLAAAIAQTGRRVLVIDMDPQSNCSQTLLPDYFEIVQDENFYSVNDLLEHDYDPADLDYGIRPTAWERVDVIAAVQDLASRELEGAMGVEYRLSNLLTGLDRLEEPYDVVLIDCPPSINRLTANGLLAARRVLLVTLADSFGWNALLQTTGSLERIQRAFRVDVEVAGLCANKVDNTKEADRWLSKMREEYGDLLLAELPQRAALAAAVGQHVSVFEMASRRSDARPVGEMMMELARKLGLVGRREHTPLPDLIGDDETEDATEAKVAVG